ncbi:MAG: biotin transporter BioY [Holosporales bacterium]|jgi:biotin transport system substrate-specific component|nr:biotin transporter BioY [Holosporales bacterium]
MVSVLRKQSVLSQRLLNELPKCLLWSLVIAIGAQLSIPLTPVPLTMQTLSVMLAGFVLGPTLGVYAVALYLIEGIIGFPVLSGFRSGVAHILGPTGGYIIGFLFAAYIVGTLREKSVFLAGLLAEIAVLVFGYLHLSSLVGPLNAYLVGVAPFYFNDILKLLLFVVLTKHKK